MKTTLFFLTFILLPKTFAGSWTCQYALTDNITGYSTYHPVTVQACSQMEASNVTYNKWCTLAWPVNRTCSVSYSSCQSNDALSSCRSTFKTRGELHRIPLMGLGSGSSTSEAIHQASMDIQLKASVYTHNCESNLQGRASFTTKPPSCAGGRGKTRSAYDCYIEGLFICTR